MDSELLAYGKSVSDELRSLLATLNTLDQQSAGQQSQLTPDVRRVQGLLPTHRTVNYGGFRMRQFVPFGYEAVDTSGSDAHSASRFNSEP